MVAVPGNVSTVPSPQDTFRLDTLPSTSAAAIVSDIGWPVVAVVVDSEKVTVGGRSLMVLIAVEL